MNEHLTLTEEEQAVLLHEPSLESNEGRQIRNWRLEQFERLGFAREDVLALTASQADLNDARQLISQGCPAKTAARILL